MREQIIGIVLDDEAGLVGGGWLSNNELEHAQKSDYEVLKEHGA